MHTTQRRELRIKNLYYVIVSIVALWSFLSSSVFFDSAWADDPMPLTNQTKISQLRPPAARREFTRGPDRIVDELTAMDSEVRKPGSMDRTLLECISRNYNIGKILRIEIPKEGLARKPLIIITDRGKHVLKESRVESSFDDTGTSLPDKIHSRFLIIDYLAQNGFSEIVRVHSTKDGAYFVKHRESYYVLHPFIEGDVNNITDEQLFKLIAEYQNVIKDLPNPREAGEFTSKAERFRKRFEYLKRLYSGIERKPIGECSGLEGLLLEQFPAISRYVDGINRNLPIERYDKLPRIVIHGDFVSWNVISDKEGTPVGLIDPQFSYDPRIADLTKLRYTDEIAERLIIDRLLTYQTYIKEKLTTEEVNSLREIFIMESLGTLFWYYEMYERKLQGEEIEWLDIQRMRDRLDEVNKLFALDWDKVHRELLSDIDAGMGVETAPLSYKGVKDAQRSEKQILSSA